MVNQAPESPASLFDFRLAFTMIAVSTAYISSVSRRIAAKRFKSLKDEG
jgi:hypothetical protein